MSRSPAAEYRLRELRPWCGSCRSSYGEYRRQPTEVRNAPAIPAAALAQADRTTRIRKSPRTVCGLPRGTADRPGRSTGEGESRRSPRFGDPPAIRFREGGPLDGQLDNGHRTAARSCRARGPRSRSATVERRLADSELFFSTTDAKGVITAGNRVFERVSGYSLDELIGRAHNIVRHPDMPRAVFQVLWDTIGAGQPVAAYVKNRAKDGSYYWVLASVAPIAGGYLSVRLAPGGEHFAMAKAVYEQLVALEREIEGDDVRERKHSIEASVSRCGELLAEAGYPDYYAFMRAALSAEVARRARPATGGSSASARDASRERPSWRPRDPVRVRLDQRVSGQPRDRPLALRARSGRALAEHSSYLRAMGDDVRLFALNAQIGASRLGEQGAALDAVARLLTEQSQATSPLVATVAERAANAVHEIEEMTFQLSLSTIQAETIAVFAHELCRRAGNPADDSSEHGRPRRRAAARERPDLRRAEVRRPATRRGDRARRHTSASASTGSRVWRSTAASSSRAFPTPDRSAPCSPTSSARSAKPGLASASSA